MKKIIFISGLIAGIWILCIITQPLSPVETRIVNITEVWLMNSGIMVWGYWDNSTIEECEGLFQTGFMYHDIGHLYKVSFKEWPDPDVRCLKLVKKIELS